MMRILLPLVLLVFLLPILALFDTTTTVEAAAIVNKNDNNNDNTNNSVVDSTDDSNNNVVDSMTTASASKQQPQLIEKIMQSNNDGIDNENHNDVPTCNKRIFSNPKLALQSAKKNIKTKKDKNKQQDILYLIQDNNDDDEDDDGDDYEYITDGCILEGRVYSNERYFDRDTGLPDAHQYEDPEPITYYSSTKARRKRSTISSAMIDEDDYDYTDDDDYDYDDDDRLLSM